MAKKLTGALNLSRIPKECIFIKANGDKCIYIDVLERKTPDAYSNTHTITVYDRANRQAVYLADLKPQEFGSKEASAQYSTRMVYRNKPEAINEPAAPAPAEPAKPSDASDLPF
jgi:hypothetical protein